MRLPLEVVGAQQKPFPSAGAPPGLGVGTAKDSSPARFSECLPGMGIIDPQQIFRRNLSISILRDAIANVWLELSDWTRHRITDLLTLLGVYGH